MKPLDEMPHHHMSEELVKVLCQRTHKGAGDDANAEAERQFFRVIIAYYFSVVAASMRAQIQTIDRGKVPINAYAVALATSGFGKGRSTNLIEEQVIGKFRKKMVEETLEATSAQRLSQLAIERAARRNTDEDEEFAKLEAEYEGAGEFAFSFDSATPQAVKQSRHKLLLSGLGAINLQIDEIGSNLMSNLEVLNTFLELYDVGKIKQKLIKNTKDNVRGKDLTGMTPANMLLFGTPARLLNGGKIEEEFNAVMETGFARRCMFAYVKVSNAKNRMTPQEILAQRMNTEVHGFLDDLNDQFEELAEGAHVGKTFALDEEMSLLLIEYQQMCEERAEKMPEHDDIRKAEMSHRHFKAMKLAGAYAFVEMAAEITEGHIYAAIRAVEDSGNAFERMLQRERHYAKLAQYIAMCGREVTQVDLHSDLPFYKGAAGQKSEMMRLAIAWGYQNNIVIKSSFRDGVEFITGETLDATDLTKIPVAYSDDVAYGYTNELAPFDKLHMLTQNQGMHWINHHLKDGHRCEDSVETGSSLLVIDVDGNVDMETAKNLLQDYKFLIYTTKRHTDNAHRFRMIFPTNFVLRLDSDDYKSFMEGFFDWLPFEVDKATGQRARKWLSHNGHYEYNDGKLIDVLPFIPKTTKNDQRIQRLQDQASLDNLERWVLNNANGNRNNQLLRYAMILVDAGFDFENIRLRTLDLNNKLPSKLEEQEIMATIMVTVSKAMAKRAA